MAEIGRIKEELGWLKVVFAIAAAIGVSLIGWLAQNYTTAGTFFVIAAAIGVVIVTIGIVLMNRAAIRRFKRLGDL